MKYYIWRPPSLSELSPMIFSMGLTHLGSEATIYLSPKYKILNYTLCGENYFKVEKNIF